MESVDRACADRCFDQNRAMFRLRHFCWLGLFVAFPLWGALIEGRVVKVDAEVRHFTVELLQSDEPGLAVGAVEVFRVGPGDAGIDYSGRKIRAEADFYSDRWHLEAVFPLDGRGAQAMVDANRRFRKETALLSRRNFVREGDYLPEFAMIDEEGRFLQIRELRNKVFVLNFIFTRCQLPEMCPASTARMAELQNRAADAGLEDLHFVTITFDPEFDSPGALRQYAEGYEIQLENFHLLTNSDPQVCEDLLRRFGILTVEEDGTINHTMATFLVDKNGRVAYRKEGSQWSVADFLERAAKLK
ncbi:MAG: SCO family protein [Coraliomargaritaceae bacterium]